MLGFVGQMPPTLQRKHKQERKLKWKKTLLIIWLSAGYVCKSCGRDVHKKNKTENLPTPILFPVSTISVLYVRV